MAGMAGLTAEEQRIYDEFSAGMRALSDKAKSDAKAIGADIMSIIGPTEAAVVSDVKKVEGAIVKLWGYLLRFLDFLDDPRGKFSYKRVALVAVAALVTSFESLLPKATGLFPALLRGSSLQSLLSVG